MTQTEWIKTANRFVAFFDILGFKELVLKSTHEEILGKLNDLKSKVNKFGNLADLDVLKEYKITKDQTKSVTFSDSFIFFSKGQDYCDAIKILMDSYAMLLIATELKLSIKGAISFGQVTVDFENSLFFGQPIIDSFLLHNELEMLTVIVDEKFEVQLNSLLTDAKLEIAIDNFIVSYRANLKSGKIRHKLIKPFKKSLSKRIEKVSALYFNTSGSPRKYIDNTLDFFESLDVKLTAPNESSADSAGESGK